MWSVICFHIDNCVDVIPDYWYNKGMCAWPKKKSDHKKFIESRTEPNEEDFDFYHARLLSQNIRMFYKYNILLLL